MREYGPMADPQAEARIRDLEQRMAAMPGSRIFVGLAEEYRRAGRFGDALATLRTGLEAHPAYLSARIAIARLYQEMGRDDEAIDAFARVLAADRENLVAAKALGDLYARRGNAVEAVKKYKLYRALAGDRAIDDKIAALEKEAKVEAPPPTAPPPSSPPPAAEPRMFDPINFSDSSAEFRFDANATLALSTLEFSPAEPTPAPEAPPESGGERETEEAASVREMKDGVESSRAPTASSEAAGSPAEITLPDLVLPEAASAAIEAGEASSDVAEETSADEAEGASADVEEVSGGEVWKASRIEAGEAFGSAGSAAAEPTGAIPPLAAPSDEVPAGDRPAAPEMDREAMTRETSPSEELEPLAPPPELPPSRTLAELYERQGFREEARRIYERLAADHPDDESLTRRIAAVRGEPSPAPAEDLPARKRRALEAWLARVKGNAEAGDRRP